MNGTPSHNKPHWLRRFAGVAVLLGVVLILVAIFGGPFAMRWAMNAGQLRMENELGLTISDEDADDTEAGVAALSAFLPGEFAYFRSPQARWLSIDFAVTRDVEELRRCVARVGECNALFIQRAEKSHGPVVAAMIRSARPQSFSFYDSGAFTPEIGEALADVGTVEDLWMENVRLEGNALAAFSRADSITNATLMTNIDPASSSGPPTRIDAEAFRGLTSAPNLTRLDLRSCQLTPAGDWAAAGASHLKHLTLHDVVWPAQSGEWLAAMPALETLYISGGDRRDLSPETLARIPSLVNLSIGSASLDDAWVERFPSLPNLQELSLGYNPLSIASQRALLKRLPQLTTFSPSDVNATPDEIEALRTEFPQVSIRYEPVVTPLLNPPESDPELPAEGSATSTEEPAPPADQPAD